jgi:hypothetical protein
MGGDYTDLTGTELENLIKAMEDTNPDDDVKFDSTIFLQNIFGADWETKLQELGFENATEYVDSFSEGIIQAKGTFDEALAKLGTNSPLADLGKNASIGAVTNMAQHVERAETVSGSGSGLDF